MIKIRALIDRYASVLSYLFFGALTTLINFLVYFPLYNWLGFSGLLSNMIAWVVAVAFAFVTNKLFVFESKSWKPKVLFKELPTFVGARLLTLGLEEAGLLVLIEWLHLDTVLTLPFIGGEMIIKIIISVVVVVLNYVFSKVLIFKKK